MIISIINHKGGTGKTTTTLNLGSALASIGYKVLLVDLDAQASLTYSLGVENSTRGISEALLGEAQLEELILEREGLHLLPSNENLSDVELSLAQLEDRNHQLQSLLVHQIYDFVLIDCPPSLSIISINALVASNYVIVPMQMDVLALRGLQSILGIINKIKSLNPSIQVLGVLPVMIDPRKNIHLEILNHIKSNYNTRIFKSQIHTSVKANEAPSFGQSVIRYAPQSRTAQDYKSFAKEMLKVLNVHYQLQYHYAD